MKPPPSTDPAARIADALPAEDPRPRDSAIPRRRRWRAALAAGLGTVVGLGVTELAFRHRDGGAFPLVNVYERDEARGVRLRPGSVTRVGRPGAPATEVRVNRDGYRGAEWPAPSPDQVLVVGDSQSFGLGVAEDQTLSARLQAKLGRPVLDASVPTYGPPEYTATLRTLLPSRSPATVVVAINLLNDFSELAHPNVERHTALDGWAVRADLGAARGSTSPLREAVIGRSHAAFAAWKWWRTRELGATEVAPDPGWEELVMLVESSREAARAGDQRRDESDRRALAAADGELIEAQRAVLALVRKHTPLVAYAGATKLEWDEYLRTDGEPEDRVFELSYGGCGGLSFYGRGSSSYRARFPASRIKDDVERLLREVGDTLGFAEGTKSEIREAFARRDVARARLDDLRSARPPPPTEPRPALPMTDTLRELRAVVPGRLIVLAVPVDVGVSPRARAERGASDADASAASAMAASLVAEARALGAEAVDPTAALSAAGDSAFLPDGHLAPAGHDAVARALAAAIATPPG